ITPKDISVTIDPATLDITSFTCSETTLSWEKGTSGVTFSVVENSIENETVKLMLYIEKGGQKSYDFDSVDESVAKTVTVTIPNRLDQGTYTIGVELADASLYPANGNYVLTNVQSKIRKTFRVTGLGLTLTEENMPWVYKYTDKDGMENIVNILAQESVTARYVKLTYTGNEYEFSIDTEELALLGAVIDTSQGNDGFSGDTKWTNAITEKKSVTVYWKPAEGYEGNGGSYTLTYEIEKAKYDLTNAKWDYTGPKEYNPLQDQKVRITGLPDGLTITDTNYRDNSKRAAEKYTAKIVGTLGNANASNYYTPSVTDKNTYIYNKDDGVFPWTLEWEIKPKEITLTWIQKASENNDFTYWVVVGEEAELIDQNGYLFYAEENYDDLTGTSTGDSIQLSEITVPKREVHYYWVVAVLKDAKNYTMANKAQSFSVGSLKEMVKVKLKDTQPFIYNGSPYGQEIIVESDESILTSAQIVKKYYKD
ncbi:MAG: hypothetical protein K2J13_00915, partial [Clostridia bacterium]|nr:hypothetical protein [Clostridia bacterium]